MKVANCFRRDRDQQASKHMIGVIGAWFLAIEHKQVKKKNKKFPLSPLVRYIFCILVGTPPKASHRICAGE